MKAQALLDAGGASLDLRRLEMAPELTREVPTARSCSQFVTFGGGGEGAVATGPDDVLRVVQQLMVAKVITQGPPSPPANGARIPLSIPTR